MIPFSDPLTAVRMRDVAPPGGGGGVGGGGGGEGRGEYFWLHA